jgi:hypothetical protein
MAQVPPCATRSSPSSHAGCFPSDTTRPKRRLFEHAPKSHTAKVCHYSAAGSIMASAAAAARTRCSCGSAPPAQQSAPPLAPTPVRRTAAISHVGSASAPPMLAAWAAASTRVSRQQRERLRPCSRPAARQDREHIRWLEIEKGGGPDFSNKSRLAADQLQIRGGADRLLRDWRKD